MEDKNPFMSKLCSDFLDLMKIMTQKKYSLLVPPKNLITVSSLTKNFYYNHIFYVSKYNEHLYVNLNGKVLKYEHPKFTTYLGWKKEMTLTITDSYKYTVPSTNGQDIDCLAIDNVSEEVNYTENKSNNKNQLKRCSNQKEYLQFYQNYNTIEEKYKNAINRLNKFTKEMKQNYMFLKGHEENYSMVFTKRFAKLVQIFNKTLRNTKDDSNLVYTVATELVDSLIFNDIYKYIFNDCLVKFYEQDEKKIKEILKDKPARYEWEGLKVEPVFKQCKFLSAIQLLDNINKFSTLFEKIQVLSDVNTLITEEAKNIYETDTKKNFIPQGDILLTFWTYVVAHCKTENIIAESQFLRLFRFGYGQAFYVTATFNSAVDTIVMELLQGERLLLNQYVEPNIISINTGK